VRLVKYAIPANKHFRIKTFEQGCEPVDQMISEVFHEKIYQEDYIVVQLMKNIDHNLVIVKELPFRGDVRKGVGFEFSKDGKFFSLSDNHSKILKVFKIDDEDIEAGIQKIQDDDCYKEYKDLKILDSCYCKAYFDLNSRFLALYTKEAVMILELSSLSTEIKLKNRYKIDKSQFTSIIDLQLVSTNDTTFRCDLACKLKDQNCVVIY
jgi:hypothetical protein